MSGGGRHLTVLGEFKPYGLVAEALDGNSSDDAYSYFLFDPQIVRQRDEVDDDDEDSATSATCRGDHELFIKGNRIIWTTGSRVYKRFSSPAPVIMACWCRLGNMPEANLCVLQNDSLTIYSISGEVTSICVPPTIISIWALPFGLLLQQASEGYSAAHGSFSSSPSLVARNLFRSKREAGYSPQYNFSVTNSSDNLAMGYGASMSSHLVFRDPLEELQSTLIEERGKLNVMKEFDDRTIWTSDCVPLMATYNRGKMQHCLWFAQSLGSDLEVENPKSSDVAPAGVLLGQFSFHRIWQGKGAQAASSKIFLASDEDATPVVCLLLQDQNKLLSLRLQKMEISGQILYDIAPDMSWSVPAIAAEAVTVTRSRVKMGSLPYRDIIVLTAEGALLLYSGKQCLCRYVLPSCLWRGLNLNKLAPEEKPSILHDYKIVGLADAVDGRINIIVNNGKIYRCALHRSLSSSLANDCIIAMSEGLQPGFYNHFLTLLWGSGDSTYLSEPDSSADFEWESYITIINKISTKAGCVAQRLSGPVSNSSWDFLLNSNFHKKYHRADVIKKNPTLVSPDFQISNSNQPYTSSHGSEKLFNSELLTETLNILHEVYESLKLNNLRKQDLGLLVILLCDVATFLGEGSYLDHYIRDFPGLSTKFGMRTQNLGKTPPSLFWWLENCLQHGCRTADMKDLPLICKAESSVMSCARKVIAFYSLLCGAKHSGKNLSSGVFCNIASGSSSCSEELVVLAMVGEKFGLQQVDLLPFGVSLPLRHALDKCRESPPSDWPAAAYVLLGREDLAWSHLSCSSKSKELDPQTSTNFISMSTPYMLHLHPITIPSSSLDTSGGENAKLETAEPVDESTVDGMEHIFNSSTQLRFGSDLRLNEVRRLLCSSRPVAIRTSVNPTASDQESQQAQLWHLAQRTTALPFGRGAFTLATTSTLLTEALAVPKLVLAGRLPAQQNATVNLDPSARNIPELKAWPEFHNAVAAGLRLAPLQGKMPRTWIIYNKPEEPNDVHAGMLLALGLHGHLRVLNITDIYKYYTQEHESTSVGLMLGLAASYRGTMNPTMSKSLYVHVPARHPSSYPELELPTLLQSAALVSVGLLYEGSAHPQTMKHLLAEIGRRSGGDNVLEREGYAVSAGFSLGLVALGRGEDTIGFMETCVERLFQYIGGKEVYRERSMSMTTSAGDHNRGAEQMMDGTPLNIDVTAPGAIMALALMFLKTESELVVSRLSIPCTQFELQYVRPDFIMLRVIARNLIMWRRVHPSKDWIKSQIPEVIQNGIRDLGDDEGDVDEMDAESFIQAYVNIVAGACISIGLKFAGTRNADAQELLYDYAIYFLNEIKPVSVKSCTTFPKGLSSYVDRGTLEICLHLIALSLSVVMAGSGHLQTLRLLKFLRSRNPTDGHANYGSQMTVSLGIGFLFLGSGMRTFSTTNSAIAALLITLYPRLPEGPNDNRCLLQAFRHLYVLATEARWIQTIDVDTGLPVYAPLEVTIKESEHYGETSFCEVAPCLLPERSLLKYVRVCGPRYWPQVMELVPEDKPWWSIGDKNDPFNSGVIYIKRKVGACSYVDDPVGCQSLLSRAMHKVFGLASMRASSMSSNDGLGGATIDQLVSTFSSDPSLIAFAQLCSDPSWNKRSGTDFQEFCLQVLFECVSKDRPALLQVYLSMYTMLGAMTDQVTSRTSVLSDSLFICSLKLALAYNEALLGEKFTNPRGSIIQSAFLGALSKRVDKLLKSSSVLENHFQNYLKSGTWPNEDSQNGDLSILLSWYLQWYSVPSPDMIKLIVEKLKPVNKSSLPLLRLLLPKTHVKAVMEIEKLLCS